MVVVSTLGAGSTGSLSFDDCDDTVVAGTEDATVFSNFSAEISDFFGASNRTGRTSSRFINGQPVKNRIAKNTAATQLKTTLKSSHMPATIGAL